jgi:protein-S-isoprenylcysteine O-methyltransferase
MHYGIVILSLWLFFWAYWAISARRVKRNIYQERDWWRSLAIAAVVIFLVLRLVHVAGPKSRVIPHSAVTSGLATALCAAGLGFAIWARRHLGANWSARPSIKQDHELVTSGPYRFVRHPIYTGILVAVLGSAFINQIRGLVIFVLLGAMFAYKVRVEERLMTQQFPDKYPEYKKKTKALIPFVW